MKIYLRIGDQKVAVQARAEGEGLLGDLFQTVRPGGRFGTLDYQTLLAMGNGEHDYPQKVRKGFERVLKYRPDQLREPKGSSTGGQFASTGSHTVNDPVAFYGSALIKAIPQESDQRKARQEMIDEAVKHVADFNSEAAAWLTADGIRHYREGDEGSVQFKVDDPETKSLQGSIFYHSHPSGFPFSGADLDVMVAMGLKEMHAVDRWGGDFKIEPVPGVTDWHEVDHVYCLLNRRLTNIVGEHYQHYLNKVNNSLPEFAQAGKADHDSVFNPDHALASIHYDYALRIMQDVGLIKYTPRPGLLMQHIEKAMDGDALRAEWDAACHRRNFASLIETTKGDLEGYRSTMRIVRAGMPQHTEHVI